MQKNKRLIEDFDIRTWLKYEAYEGLNYTDYASDILNYRPLFGKELNSTKILILIKLWENKTIEGTYHSLEILGRAAGIKSTYVSTYIEEMCQSNLPCLICGQQFGIIEKIGKHKYESNKEGNLYSLEKIEALLKHITTEHCQPNPKEFFEFLTKVENEPRTKSTDNQIINLKQQWEKRKKI